MNEGGNDMEKAAYYEPKPMFNCTFYFCDFYEHGGVRASRLGELPTQTSKNYY